MAMGSYSTLLTDIPSWLENDSSELAAAIPTIIESAENRLYRDLLVQALETQINGTLSSGEHVIPRPSDLVSPRYLYIVTPTGVRNLQFKALEYLFEYWPDFSQTGVPVYYAVDNANEYHISPTANQDYAYVFGYKRRLARLSPTNPTNWITENAYDAMLAACLADAGRFVLDDRQTSVIGIWENKYNSLVQAMNAVEQRAERDDFRIPYVNAENE